MYGANVRTTSVTISASPVRATTPCTTAAFVAVQPRVPRDGAVRRRHRRCDERREDDRRRDGRESDRRQSGPRRPSQRPRASASRARPTVATSSLGRAASMGVSAGPSMGASMGVSEVGGRDRSAVDGHGHLLSPESSHVAPRHRKGGGHPCPRGWARMDASPARGGRRRGHARPRSACLRHPPTMALAVDHRRPSACTVTAPRSDRRQRPRDRRTTDDSSDARHAVFTSV